MVQEIIELGGDVNQKNCEGKTPLEMLLSYVRIELFNKIISLNY